MKMFSFSFSEKSFFCSREKIRRFQLNAEALQWRIAFFVEGCVWGFAIVLETMKHLLSGCVKYLRHAREVESLNYLKLPN